MLPIRPHLWFNHNKAKEAAAFYTSLMPDSAITCSSYIKTPAGNCDIVEFIVAGQPFMGISGGPSTQINPSISFMINFDPSRDGNAVKSIDEVWSKLIEGGTALMPIDRYPFSERYGWVADKYGISWQLILTNPAGEERPTILPSMMFTGDVAGKAEEAMDFYCSIFNDGKRGATVRYPEGRQPDKEGTIMFADFYVDHTWITAMDSAYPHGFSFNEAVSLLLPCETQEEIDYYSAKLAATPDSVQCGWLKDKFGVSWQVSTALMIETLKTGSREQVDNMVEAFMPMKKVDLTTLQKAADTK